MAEQSEDGMTSPAPTPRINRGETTARAGSLQPPQGANPLRYELRATSDDDRRVLIDDQSTYSESWLLEHTPELYAQWRHHNDNGIRREISNRIDGIYSALDGANNIEEMGYPTYEDDRLDIAAIHQEHGHSDAVMTAALDRRDQGWTRRRVITNAEAQRMRQSAALADIALGHDELATYRSGSDAPATTPPAPPTQGKAAAVNGDRRVDSRHQVQATYSGQRRYVTFTVDLDLKMRVELQAEPTDLSARNVERLLPRITQDPSITDITVDDRPHAGINPATEAPAARAEPQDELERTPPGGWTEADRVRPAQPRDTSCYRSAQQFPLGAELTVYATGEDGPGRQLGHGVVVDHPGPEHVTVESLDGTRRISPISHVRHADPNDPSRPAPTTTSPPAVTPGTASAAERWAHLFTGTEPEVLSDPHWPTLAAQMDRIAATGADIDALVDQVIAARALPADNPARSLDYRLANAAPRPTGPRPQLEADAPAVARPIPPAPTASPHRPGPSR